MNNFDYKKDLSVVIPSFNRKTQLLRLLKSLYSQESIKEIKEVLIIDNSSDYDLEFLKDEYTNIRIHKNKINIGMTSNIINTFYLCNTKWMWLISDDDIALKNSIKEVLKLIESNDESVGLIKCSFEVKAVDKFREGEEKDKVVSDLEQFVDYYDQTQCNGKIRRGSLVFMSNGIYNRKVLEPYLRYGFEYSYTQIPHIIPILFGLNERKILVRFSSLKIIEYNPPKKGTEWPYVKVSLGLSTLYHLPLTDLKEDLRKRLLFVIMCIPYKSLFRNSLINYDRSVYKIYGVMYNTIYSHYLNFGDKILSNLFLFILKVPSLAKLSKRILKID